MWGLASPPRPSGRTESCTLRILRMLLGDSREEVPGRRVIVPRVWHCSDERAATRFARGLRTWRCSLWITRAGLAVDFPALRARAHISACCGLVD